MTEFKIGDKIALQSWIDSGYGYSEVAAVNENGYRLWDKQKMFSWIYPKTHNWIQEPKKEENKVAVTTETKIKSGVYGLLELFSHDEHEVTIELRYVTAKAKDLRETANVLNEIATILEGQSK